MEYTRDLGYCAAKYLDEGGNAVLITIQDGHFVPLPFEKMLDSVTGKARVRMVDIESARYKIARRYMIRYGAMTSKIRTSSRNLLQLRELVWSNFGPSLNI